MAAKKKTSSNTNTSGGVAHTPPQYIGEDHFYGKRLDNEQLNFANAIWCKDVDIIFCNAKAGCGKTFVATGVANMLVEYGMYNGIVYVMSPYADKVQGFLPGSIEEKSSVYFDAFIQALYECRVNVKTAINNAGITEQEGTSYITCVTDTYLRGTNIKNKVVIIDEAQNMTVPQLLKILTRVDDSTKVIVIGHTKQCDLQNPEESGFESFINLFNGQDRCAVCGLSNNHRGWISRLADEIELKGIKSRGVK